MEIIIFTNNGFTYHFKNCTKLTITSDSIKFNYFGESTKVYRDAEFKFISTSGYAIHDETNDVIGE